MITMINRICGCVLVLGLVQPAMGSAQEAAKSSEDIVWSFDEAGGAVAHDAASEGWTTRLRGSGGGCE